MSRSFRAVEAPALGLALLFLAGCCAPTLSRGPETLVVVVPSRHDGHVGAVVATHGEQHQVLDTAYASARLRPAGRMRRAALTKDDVDRIFSAASEALPPRATSYTLYFGLGTEALTAESSRLLDDILGDVAGRQAAEIIVVGHTDRMGTDERNQRLSLKRAERMRALVIQRGAAGKIVHAVGMGEREPFVATDDGVAEPRNRRVEIIVR